MWQRIKTAREFAKLTQDQLGDFCGVSRNAVSQWESPLERNGTVPKLSRLQKIAARTGVSLDWLLTERGDMLDNDGIANPMDPASLIPSGAQVVAWDTVEDLPDGGKAYVFIPHYDVSLSAGEGCCCEWHEHSDNEPLSFRAKWFQSRGLNPVNCKALYVKGSSMDPTLVDGDTVMIDTSRTEIRDGNIYAVIYYGELYVKRLFRIPGGGIELRSDNPAHRSREVTGTDLEALFVLGEKVWRAG